MMRKWWWVLLLGSSAPVLSLVLTTPAAAAQSGCKTKKKKGFGSFLGSIAGQLAANSVENKVGGGQIGGLLPTNTLNAMLADSIACALAADEREKAADATTKVVERKVGATESWQSDSRPAVSGSSTVVAEVKVADGSTCKDVRDVATIDGEEKTVTKRMCRAPGQAGYKMQTAAA